MASQTEALSGQIRWRVVGIQGWFDDSPRPVALPPRTLPEGLTASRFARRLEAHMTAHTPGPLRQRVFLADPADGALPAATTARQSLAARGLLHAMDAHLGSSQRFAVNLFAPLSPGALAALVGEVFGLPAKTLDPVVFEFADPRDRLAERTPGSPYQTTVDVLLAGSIDGGRRVLALVEVKLSESDFGCCSGYQNPRNATRETCLGGGPFGGDPASCFQLGHRDQATVRAYDRHLGTVRSLPGHAGCLFRLGLNQPLRNLALARALLADGEADQVAYVLCAHDHNPAIWRRWADTVQVFGADAAVTLASVPASRVVRLHQHQAAAWLRRTYALP